MLEASQGVGVFPFDAPDHRPVSKLADRLSGSFNVDYRLFFLG